LTSSAARADDLAMAASETPVVETRVPLLHFFADDGIFPNSYLPVLVYPQAALPANPSRFEALFAEHGWTGSWRNGLYSVRHFHSSAHEVLGIYRGRVRVRLGGAQGAELAFNAGDVLVIPAGVAHENVESTADFAVVGAYPSGTGPDMQYGRPGERPSVDQRIAKLALPTADPVYGGGGPLTKLWKSGQRG
jgi:uncharacterized protein YjlB